MTNREGQSLLAWQWASYTSAHRDRRNLAIHIVTNPIFVGGGLALLASALLLHPWLALAGLVAMPLAMAMQGWGHRMEDEPPAPFRGPLDVVARIFAEQWITFPRFVLTGGFVRAWRAAR
jgi:hypothetical protein